MFQQKTLRKADFPAKMTGAAMVQPASSDKWQEPLLYIIKRCGLICSTFQDYNRLFFCTFSVIKIFTFYRIPVKKYSRQLIS